MNDGGTGSSLHFLGELYFEGALDPWMGIPLAIAVAAIAWWLYRMETKKGVAPPLNVVLPLLRAIAVALIMLTLVGPIFKGVEEEGQRGRVLVFLDASQSMSIKDDHMSAGRKLLLAERHGWLPKDQNLLDPALQDAADLLSEARINLSEGLEDPAANLKELSENFANTAKKAADLLDGKNYEVPTNVDRKGVLHHETWKGIGGNSVNDLKQHARFREGKPDSRGFLKAAESPVNVGDNFGRRIWARLVPPETGEYRFWVYSDDECAVYLNNAGVNPDNAREILRHTSYGNRSWSEERRSRPITLSQGKAYHFEILHKEGGSQDYCAVGWTLPSGRMERPIPGNRFRVPNSETAPPFSELRESMRAEVALFAENLEKGQGGASETAMRDALTGLVETVLSYENSFRSTFELYAENLAGSDDESIHAALASFDATDRWDRATRLLTQRSDSILKELSDTHVIEVRALNGPDAERLWDNGGGAEPPNDFGPSAETKRTDISSGVRSTVKTDGEDETSVKNEGDGQQPRTVAVILTDGLHNEGASPLETAKLLDGRDLPIYTVGFGGDKSPPDLAVLEIEAPTKVMKDDRLRGSVSLKDNLPAGTIFKVVVEDEQGEIVWEKELVGMNALRRRVDFDFSMEEMVEERISSFGLDNSVQLNSIPFRMKIKVEPVKGEVRDDNNERSFAFDAITKKNSLLIIDGRPRWETRYIRNLFERDERWSATGVFADPGSDHESLPRGEEGDVFPTEKNALFAYDLIILGEIGPKLLKEEELEWIRDFVANRGGGVILLDGARQKFREHAENEDSPIASLLPVKWAEEGPKRLSPHALRLTEGGLKNPALFLHPSTARNEELWGYIPKPGWVAPTEALPGSEVHLEATIDEDGENAVPLLVSRPVGAGKTLYVGFDGTWRWRYEVADKYHQRYWHQIASWIMEQPFAVSDDFVALDAGASTYRPGEMAELRIRVRDREGKPLEDPEAEVEALVWQDGKIVATVPMKSNAESGGLFKGKTPALNPGEHTVTVRVSEIYEENELRSKVGFLVEEPESPELATLTCNEELLREVAELSGGRFLREEQIGRLNELLKPISSGKLVKTEFTLWQSYWWLIPIVLLLGVELFLRKRAGML